MKEPVAIQKAHKKNIKGEITKQQKQLVDLIYCRGIPQQLAWKQTFKSPYTQKNCESMLNKKGVLEYIAVLQGDATERIKISRDILVDELRSRLRNANDGDAVRIVQTISKMLGLDAPEQIEAKVTKLEVVWVALGDGVDSNQSINTSN